MSTLTPVEPPKRRLRRAVVGPAMASEQLEETLLPKTLALPIFASDPLSSVAYATESALVVLLAASATSAHLVFPLSLAIAALLAIVVVSYRQTVQAYEVSGGAYVVARENLGTFPSVVAAAALLTDYVLTVAVSIAAGIFAITSFAPSLEAHKVGLSLACVLLIALANLRGVRESGLLFALPTYAFVTAMGMLVIVGLVDVATGHAPQAVVPHPLPVGAGAVTLFVLLRAFSSGSTALTGVEAIANGVNAFRHPQGRNAATTLAVLGVIAIFLFLGVSYLAVHVHARPSATASVVSQIARAVFAPGSAAGFMFYVVQALTLTILILAANTSFQGFPRLAALLARDRFFPRQFTNLGDRLVLSNGMLVLATAAALLLWAYGASVDSLIHLYVIGVFTAFTISQAGMARYWRRRRPTGWRRRAIVNGIGGAATGIVTAIVIYTKFSSGAWLVIVAIPTIVAGCYGIRRHYRELARRLRAGAAAVAAAPEATNRTLLVLETIDAAAKEAFWFGEAISRDSVRVIHVPDGRSDPGIRPRWFRATGEQSQLEVVTPEGGRTATVVEQVWRYPRGESEFVTVVVPELFRRPSLLEQVRRRSTLRLKLRLLSEPSVAIADIPVLGDGGSPPTRLVCRVLVADVHAASMRAVNYAHALGIDDTRALSFAFGEAEAAGLRREWGLRGPRLPLEIDAAPYRDLRAPLLRHLGALKAKNPEAAVVVVMPELILRGWRRLLHNQRALYIKRLLLFEPRVILISVPYQLLR